jgi:hypothetical protein
MLDYRLWMANVAAQSMKLEANAELAALNRRIDDVRRHLQSLRGRRGLYGQILLS